MNRPERNGWSVLYSSADGGSKTCGRPHGTHFAAILEKTFGWDRGHPVRTVVDHDAEMRRWGYDMGIIEPTPEERAGLPIWHENYETIPPRISEERERDAAMVEEYRRYDRAHADRTGFVLSWHQWLEHRDNPEACECRRRQDQ